ncbi:hypothetical protein M885DRAFT_609780 [Pelagophyceae sp. CCMP2097]|nr:hypothetical protein M885DRAFT_609780 [Pelagophyceae sp. CCMP2097]
MEAPHQTVVHHHHHHHHYRRRADDSDKENAVRTPVRRKPQEKPLALNTSVAPNRFDCTQSDGDRNGLRDVGNDVRTVIVARRRRPSGAAQTQLAQTQLAQTQLATPLAATQLAQTQLAQTQLAQTQLATRRRSPGTVIVARGAAAPGDARVLSFWSDTDTDAPAAHRGDDAPRTGRRADVCFASSAEKGPAARDEASDAPDDASATRRSGDDSTQRSEAETVATRSAAAARGEAPADASATQRSDDDSAQSSEAETIAPRFAPAARGEASADDSTTQRSDDESATQRSEAETIAPRSAATARVDASDASATQHSASSCSEAETIAARRSPAPAAREASDDAATQCSSSETARAAAAIDASDDASATPCSIAAGLSGAAARCCQSRELDSEPFDSNSEPFDSDSSPLFKCKWGKAQWNLGKAARLAAAKKKERPPKREEPPCRPPKREEPPCRPAEFDSASSVTSPERASKPVAKVGSLFTAPPPLKLAPAGARRRSSSARLTLPDRLSQHDGDASSHGVCGGVLVTSPWGRPCVASAFAAVMGCDDDEDENGDEDDKGGTLILASSCALADEWHAALRSRRISVLKHGVTAAALRRATVVNLKRFVAVVATYAHATRLDDMDFATSAPRSAGALGVSALHRVRWRRVICDDAHLLFNFETARSRAVDRLDARARWALVSDAKADVLPRRSAQLRALADFVRLSPRAPLAALLARHAVSVTPADVEELR